MQENKLLYCKRISKTFPGVKALDTVDFNLDEGEIHGLIGENGAGKSTLMKILSGVYYFDAELGFADGDKKAGIYLKGKQIFLRNPKDAIEKKIVTIHQELNVIPHTMVYENIFLNHPKYKTFLNRKRMIENTWELINDFGVDIKPDDIVGNLSVDKQKLVEVLKAISREVEILIFDEPTSFLTEEESEHLLKVIKRIANNRIGVIFISHDLNEVIKISDRISVMRDGKIVGDLDKENANIDTLVSMMIGKKLDVKNENPSTQDKGLENILEVKNLFYKDKLFDINFRLKVGEILGITGMVDSGKNELSKVLFGVENYKFDKGSVLLNGSEIKIKSTENAIRNGIALLTEDRKEEGLFLKFTLYDNITISSIKKYINKLSLIRVRKQMNKAKEYINRLKIRANNPEVIVESLSGGNQQKAVIAKWLDTKPRVFIMNDPTVGIDVAAKFEIRGLIKELIKENRSVILITNEYNEIKELCNRILVMYKGKIVKELANEEIDKNRILKYSGGGVI